jgi:hypothetical protein
MAESRAHRPGFEVERWDESWFGLRLTPAESPNIALPSRLRDGVKPYQVDQAGGTAATPRPTFAFRPKKGGGRDRKDIKSAILRLEANRLRNLQVSR